MFSLYNDLVYTYLCYDIAKIRDIKLENNPEECYHEDRGYYNDRGYGHHRDRCGR